MYNRVPRKLLKKITVTSWSYGTPTWRPAAGDASHKVEIVLGLAVEPVWLFCALMTNCASTASRYTGCSIDQSSGWSNNYDVTESAASVGNEVANSHMLFPPLVGYHWFTQIENAGASSTFAGVEYGMYGWMWG
jgi:hypothetical protein